MTFNAFLHFCAALVCAGMAGFGLFRDRQSFVHRVFAVGMLLLALDSFFTGLSLLIAVPQEVVHWQIWRWRIAALLPGCWLLFGLSFGRNDYRTSVARWKWIVLSITLLHLIFAGVFASNFFRAQSFPLSYGWSLSLSWSGYAYSISFLIGVILIIMLLEQTLRSSRGLKRYQLKFLTLGIGTIFAVRVYTGSQSLLFHTINLELELLNAAALLVASLLIVISFFRARVLQMDIYLSQTMLHNSITVLVVGIYFLILGVLAKIVRHMNGGLSLSLPLSALFIFLGLLALVLILLSDRLRLKMKRFVSYHFRRPRYDYRKAWLGFSQRTAYLLEVKDLCNEVTKMISEMFDTLSVNIWLTEDGQPSIKLCGSTVFSEARTEDSHNLIEAAERLIHMMGDQDTVLDLEAQCPQEFKDSYPDFFEETRTRYCLCLATNGDFLGLMTLGDRVGGEPFSIEELDLLKAFADQAAGSLLNLTLSERLRQAKEMQAFQTISAFFVHDLKNLASSLSMMLENLPVHFDNPTFRDDALRVISGSVNKINAMCNRLSLLKNRLEICPVEADLNEFVKRTLADLDAVFKECLVEELHHVPKVRIDAEQMQSVLINLVLNSKEAMTNGGQIHVTTGMKNGWAILSVSDNGCGMSKTFIKQSLFKPFKTTKKRGLGIGLFQSKMIIEAHQGQLEVESQEGQGSTFRVLLPLQGAGDKSKLGSLDWDAL